MRYKYNPPHLPLTTYFRHVHETTTHDQLSFIIQLYNFYTTTRISLFSGTMTICFNNDPTAPEIMTGLPQIETEIYIQEIMLAGYSRRLAAFIDCRNFLLFEWTKRGDFERTKRTHIKMKEVRIWCFLFKIIFAQNFLGFYWVQTKRVANYSTWKSRKGKEEMLSMKPSRSHSPTLKFSPCQLFSNPNMSPTLIPWSIVLLKQELLV